MDSPSGFTAHNIRLDDGTTTLPSGGPTWDQNPTTLSAGRVLHMLYPHGLEGKSIIDVGCLEGGFATEFARMGMQATGVEVRESNLRNCLYVRDRVNLPNLTFLQGDANDIERFGQFDVFFVSGLLYHLDRPRAFLEAVARNCGKALILWTHITHDQSNTASAHYNLSELAENEGLHGRWYAEHGDMPTGELDQLKWASWDNRKSFWVQREYLLQLLQDLGFDLVFEQFDCMDDIVTEMVDGFYRKIDRVMLVAVKTGLPPKRPRLVASRPVPAHAEAVAAEQPATPAERELEQARAELAAIQASTSWQLTAPLRRLATLFGRPGG